MEKGSVNLLMRLPVRHLRSHVRPGKGEKATEPTNYTAKGGPSFNSSIAYNDRCFGMDHLYTIVEKAP